MLGCVFVETNCAKYQPRPLDPVHSEAALRARTPPVKFDPESLTAFAIRNSPDVAAAQAKAAGAEAAIVTARQAVNPSLSAEGGYSRTPDSLATYAISPAFTIETAGKKGYRILAAKKTAEAARIAVYEAEWQVGSRVRTALVNYYFALRRIASLAPERDIRDEIAQIFQKRVELGEASNPEWNAARAEQAAVALTLRTAEGESSQALAAMAGALSLPASALEGKTFDLASFEDPPAPDSLPLRSVEKAGLLHRADIRRTLVEYEASDARLRLELANRYPNITLSPAYAFQEGFPAYTLGSVIESLPILHRHEGPIAEAEAARHEVETRFIALQAQVISETETALRQYRAAAADWLAARDSVEVLQKQRERAVMNSFTAGESNRLDVAEARLLTVAASRARVEAAQRAQTALGALEDAVQSPLAPGVAN